MQRQALGILLAPFLFSANQLIFNQIQDSKWGAPYEEWRKSHPAAPCRSFDGPGGTADEEWCYRCIEGSSEISFYAFDPVTPACKLGQVRAWQAASALEEVRKSVEARYGSSDSDNAVGEWSSGFWHDIQHFRTGDGEIYLYRRVERNKPETVELLARSATLVAAKAEDKRLVELDYRQRALVKTPLDQRLAQDFGGRFPALGTLLMEEPGEQPRPQQAKVLQQLLAAASNAPAAQNPEMLLAADRLAGTLPGGERGDQSIFHRTQTISGFELSYQYDALGSGWAYQHDLLHKVWQEYPNTEWGNQAFLLLERAGWDTSGVCAAGSDQFREVIAHGEKYLAGHTEVMLAVGQAYETWWSLSRAKPNDDYVEPEKYRAGADAARQKAISLYEQVNKGASLEAAYARRQLPRLKLNLDTLQRRYYCIYD